MSIDLNDLENLARSIDEQRRSLAERVEPKDVRGIAAIVGCDACEGTGQRYASSYSRCKTSCDDCGGTGEMIKSITLDTLRALLGATP